MADLDSLGQFPTDPGMVAVNFKSVTPNQVTESNSGKLRRYSYGVQYFTWVCRFGANSQTDIGPIIGYINAAYGPSLSFEIILPKVSYSKSTNPPSTVPATTAQFTRGVNTVTLDNCGASKQVLRGGDFFKFANHSKVYMCSATCTSDGAGTATLYFTGSLLTTVPNNTNLTITAVPFTAIFDGEEQSWAVANGGITNLDVGMRELF
jgi:hypothetical protein